MNEGNYYLKLSGQVEGPFTIGQIYDLWAARKINSQTLFSRFEEMDKWQPLSELTLKISAPRAAREPAPEPAPTGQAKVKAGATFKAEDYYPVLPQPQEPRPAPSLKRRKFFRPGLSRVRSFAFWSAFCILSGTGTAAYFMFFFSSSENAKEAGQSLLLLRQNGVVMGMGLVLMGGLLIIARQIEQLAESKNTEPPKRTERKISSLS